MLVYAIPWIWRSLAIFVTELWPFLSPDEEGGMFFGASVRTFCPSGTISQDLLVRFDTSLR